MQRRHLYIEREVDRVDNRHERALERVALRVDLVAASTCDACSMDRCSNATCDVAATLQQASIRAAMQRATR